MLRELCLKKYFVASLISGSWIGSVEDRCGAGRWDAILRNRLQKFDKLQSSTLDGVDLYVFGVLHGETIRQTKQRVCLYSLPGTETEARGCKSVGGWWFVYRAAWMAIYLTGKTDRRYQSLGYKWRCLLAKIFFGILRGRDERERAREGGKSAVSM